MKMKQIIFFLLIGLIFNTCLDDEFEYPPTINLTPSNPPFILNSAQARFYKDLKYGADFSQTYDLFSPMEKQPGSLCIFIHGGGFLTGDKSEFYSNSAFEILTNNLIDHNIAVASINYRLLVPNDTEGLLKSLKDGKLALQTIRYYSNILNLNKSKVVLLGNSAGAGMALWIGLSNNLADYKSDSLTLRESTRVSGIVSISTQASYDFLEWHNDVFDTYKANDFSYQSVKDLLTEPVIYTSFGIDSEQELLSDRIKDYRNKVNMLKLISEDDPEFYIISTDIGNSIPVNITELVHHPLHLKALKDQATLINTEALFYSPELNIDTTNGLSIEEFIISKLIEK